MIRDNVDVVGTDRLVLSVRGAATRIAFITPMGGHLRRGLSTVPGLLGPGVPPMLHRAHQRRAGTRLAGSWPTSACTCCGATTAAPRPAAAPVARALFDRACAELDALAFDAFWRLDREGLRDARRATPVNRYRVALDDDNRVTGYAVTGRAGPTGYLQRLAVHPDQHHRGFGTALVLDGLRWARRRGATSTLVNTQMSNSALALYQSLGFVEPRSRRARTRLEPDGRA
jgi:ribosomal protein S18 acetylase RimI-like enzyme